jgi:hypothetical protein
VKDSDLLVILDKLAKGIEQVALAVNELKDDHKAGFYHATNKANTLSREVQEAVKKEYNEN